jgi:hypothetical protein
LFELEGHRGFFLCAKGTYGKAFTANGNGAVRAEVAMETEIAAMAITDPEVAAEPGMGSVRQIKRHCE